VAYAPGNIPDDYVLATGENHTVREFVVNAFARAGYTITWKREASKRLERIRMGLFVFGLIRVFQTN
jgi:GDP-D-mannose dehydratase